MHTKTCCTAKKYCAIYNNQQKLISFCNLFFFFMEVSLSTHIKLSTPFNPYYPSTHTHGFVSRCKAACLHLETCMYRGLLLAVMPQSHSFELQT